MSTTLATNSLKPTPSATTRERLLEAAAVVFARDGLSAATTREIAHVAGVNEVTLFRLFQSKQNLLAQVLEQVFAVAPDTAEPSPEDSLESIVRTYADSYSARLRRNFPLVRVLVGEIQHFQEHELKVIRGIFKPERNKLVERLRDAQASGLVRIDADPAIIADQLCAMIFMGELKQSLPSPLEYAPADYLASSMETIVRAFENPSRPQ